MNCFHTQQKWKPWEFVRLSLLLELHEVDFQGSRCSAGTVLMDINGICERYECKMQRLIGCMMMYLEQQRQRGGWEMDWLFQHHGERRARFPVTLAAADAVVNNGAGEASGRPRLETENIRQHVFQSTSPARIMQLKQHRSKGWFYSQRGRRCGCADVSWNTHYIHVIHYVQELKCLLCKPPKLLFQLCVITE